MKRIFIVILCLFLLPSFSISSIKNPDENLNGHLLDYGIIKSTNEQQRYEVPDQPGRFSINANIEIEKTTEIIPLEKGIAFGILWALSGLKEKSIEVIYSVEHPVITLENGKKSSLVTEKMRHQVVEEVVGSIDGYILKHEYELVPGDWKVSIKYKDTEISKIFKIN